MADIVSDGMTKVAFVTTIAAPAAPTAAEMAAGEDLEGFLTPDGLGMDFGNDSVDVTALSSTYNAELPGRLTLSTELTFKHQGDTVAPFSTFAGKPEGYIVVRRNVDATDAWAENDVIETYPVQIGIRRRMAPAANELLKFTVQAFHTSAPVAGVVAA